MNNADWWANKLAQQNGQPRPAPQGRPDPMPPMPPSQQPMAPMPSFQQTPTSKAASTRHTATCPDCGSSNYFSATPQTALRCLDCGYPVQQSGSRFGGLAGANVEGAAKQAVGNTGGSWNPGAPGHIIGNIG